MWQREEEDNILVLMQRIQQPGYVPLLTTGCAYASQLSLVRQRVPTVATWRREGRGWVAAGELGVGTCITRVFTFMSCFHFHERAAAGGCS